MNTRLEQFLSAENITQAQFADNLGVARASISHILAGRNKPGYDFMLNMMRCYPTLNIEWLIAGRGKMYKNSSEPAGAPQPVVAIKHADSPADPEYGQTQQPTLFDNPVPEAQAIENKPVEPVSSSSVSGKNIVRVVAFYNDGTFKELN